jgi:hypothetical protein
VSSVSRHMRELRRNGKLVPVAKESALAELRWQSALQMPATCCHRGSEARSKTQWMPNGTMVLKAATTIARCRPTHRML